MDLFEEPPSFILFIPEVFISDCLDENIECEELRDLSNIQPENIDLIDEEDNSSNLDENISDVDDIFSKNSAELEDLPSKNMKKGLELNELLNHNFASEFIKTDHEKEIKYESLPKHFINGKSWPRTTNLSCCYCHEKINGTPYPIGLVKTKILVPENEESNETFISLITPDKTVEKSSSLRSELSEIPEYVDKAGDDHLLYSSQTLKEVKACRLHDIAGHDIVCVGNYIRKVEDPKIVNKRETMKMSIDIYKEITGEVIDDIPDKDLWITMEQYCGSSGLKRNEYREKNLDKEIKLKQAMKINN